MRRRTPDEEEAVLTMVKEGHSLRETSRATGIPLSTVRAIIERFLAAEEDDTSVQDDSSSEDDAENEGRTDDLHTPAARSAPASAQTDVDSAQLIDYARTPREKTPQSITEKDNAILRKRIESLVGRLSQLEAATASGGVAADSVAGRPSLASFRESTWKRFAGAVMGLPEYVSEHGFDETEEMIAATLTADLHTLALGAPPTQRIARMRNVLTHFLSNPAFLAVFLGRDYAGLKMRTWFLKWCADAFYRPSVAKLFDKSVENFIPPGGWEAYGG